MGKRKIPHGSYVQLDLDLISEGGFRREFERQLEKAYSELIEREQLSGDKTGVATITATVKIGRTDTETFFAVHACVTRKVPPITRKSLVKGAGGKLLCQPEGSSEDDPGQMRLFDAQGKPEGMFNASTGELIEDPGAGGPIAKISNVG